MTVNTFLKNLVVKKLKEKLEDIKENENCKKQLDDRIRNINEERSSEMDVITAFAILDLAKENISVLKLSDVSISPPEEDKVMIPKDFNKNSSIEIAKDQVNSSSSLNIL